MPDPYTAQRMEAEDIDEEEANFRDWVDVYSDHMPLKDAIATAKELRAQGYFKPKGPPAT